MQVNQQGIQITPENATPTYSGAEELAFRLLYLQGRLAAIDDSAAGHWEQLENHVLSAELEAARKASLVRQYKGLEPPKDLDKKKAPDRRRSNWARFARTRAVIKKHLEARR